MQIGEFCPLRNCQIDICNVSKSRFEPLSDLKRSHHSNLFNFEALKVSFSVSVGKNLPLHPEIGKNPF